MNLRTFRPTAFLALLLISLVAWPLAAEPTPKPGTAKKTRKTGPGSASPSPTATPKPSPKKTASPSPSRAAKKTPSPTASPKKGSPIPTLSPGNKRAQTPSPEPSPKPESSPSATPSPEPERSPAAAENATLSTSELADFHKQPQKIQELIEAALELTKQDLTYTYGSANPANGGMDCSGFIYHVLGEKGFKDVPRSARDQYVWVRKAGTFSAVLSRDAQSFELDNLRPGDLLFWTGTYNIDRDPPITHTMIYLGKEAASKKPVMVGASDGRTYEGKSRWGVSVFDFKGGTRNDNKTSARFVGYATIPGLRERE